METTQHAKQEVDLFEFWRVALKRKWIIFTTIVFIVLLGGVYTFTRVPQFRATAKILVEEPSTSILNMEEMFNYSQGNMGSYYNTQIEILKTQSLAERVAKKMNLAERPEMQRSRKSELSLGQTVRRFLLRWIKPPKEQDSADEAFVMASDDHARFAPYILDKLKIQDVDDTKLIKISFSSPYPVLSADIVNTVVEEFINFSIEMRYEATQQASDFLNEQIAQISLELAEKERELQKYGEEKRLLFLNDNESTVVNKYGDLYQAYTNAQIDRYNKESIYRELSSLRVDSMPQYVNNEIIQTLKNNYTVKQTEYEVKRQTFMSDHPIMISLSAELASLKSQLQSEIRKAREAAFSDLRAVEKQENALKEALDTQWRDVMSMNTNEILFHTLKLQVENKRKLLNELDSQKNETLVSARLKGLKTSNIKIIDKAGVPKLPFSPNKKRSMFIAIMMGLFWGAAIAFLVDYLDNTIKGPEEVEKLVGLPSLGVIPYIIGDNTKGKYYQYSRYRYRDGYGGETNIPDSGEVIEDIELVNHLYPNLSICEDYRTVRTSILFSHPGHVPKSIVLTSCFPQEGKTSTIGNLAVSFAQLDKKVILVDADLRKPRQHKVFGARNRIGLSSCLVGAAEVDDVIQETAVDNIWLMPSGPHPPNPAELVNSTKMDEIVRALEERFDFVFIDTPPVLAVIDPIVISSFVDAVVFVLKEGKTARKPLIKAISEIRKSKTNIIGVIFNEVRFNRRGYYSPYFYHYNYMTNYEYRANPAEEELHPEDAF